MIINFDAKREKEKLGEFAGAISSRFSIGRSNRTPANQTRI